MQEAAAKVGCFFKVVHGLCAEEELSYMADVTRSPPPYNEPIQIVDNQSVTVKLLDLHFARNTQVYVWSATQMLEVLLPTALS